jgi:hypothetical protein
MMQNTFHRDNGFPLSPPPRLLPILEKIKSAYLLWYAYYQILPKTHRHSLGVRIDDLFVEIIEAITTASFLDYTKKLPYVTFAIKKTDLLKILLMILWETKSLDDKKYIALSLKIDEVGRILGGWNGQIVKQLEKENSLGKKPREK